MSRFFAASDSDTSSDQGFTTSSDDFSDAGSNDSQSQADAQEVPELVAKRNFWVVGQGGDDSDSDSDDKRVIKSLKERKYDEMREFCDYMVDAMRDKDWLLVQTGILNTYPEYDKLQKAFKTLKEKTPRFYIRDLVKLDEVVQAIVNDKDAIKAYNSSTAKALNALNQKLKKEVKLRAADMEYFRENPVDAMESEEEREETGETKPAGPPTTVVTFDETSKPKDVVETNIFETLETLKEARGKKNTDKQSQIDTLVSLKASAKTPYQKAIVLNALIPVRFDFVPSVTGSMPLEMWKSALEEVCDLYDILDEHQNILFGSRPNDDELESAKDARASKGETVVLPGNPASYVDRLDDEFFKSLLSLDPHTSEYTERLRDETLLYCTLVRAQKYAELHNVSKEILDLIMLRRIEHLYYKPAVVIESLENSLASLHPSLAADAEDIPDMVINFCTSLCNASIERIRTRALLCHVYHLALKDQFHPARNLLLMSHLQDNIGESDLSTQTLYNRTLAQTGLCAFRCGMFRDAHDMLQDIFSSGKIRELLAQGSSQKYSERTPEQEKLEKSRQLPFHMHVNLDFLECVYLLSAMLLEIPNMARYRDSKRRIISKPFRRMLDYNEKQIFNGPPENNREYIMSASKEMSNGNWATAFELISSIRTWKSISNSDQVIELIKSSIQQESLKAYLMNYASHYETFDFDQLGEMFQLPTDKIKSIVAKMIYNESLSAAIDFPTNTVILNHNVNGSKVDLLASQYSEKMSILVDMNEKLLDSLNPNTEDKAKKTRKR